MPPRKLARVRYGKVSTMRQPNGSISGLGHEQVQTAQGARGTIHREQDNGHCGMKQNTLYTNDNLYVMNGMNSESVDLIYTDPPFNSKRTYPAPIGSKAAGSAFKDIWTWQDVDEACLERLYEEHPHLVHYIESVWFTHSKAMASYLTFMAQRIVEMHRILKPPGSFYLHIDPTASHYLKVICDMIFGKNNFRNEIVWCYSTSGRTKVFFAKKHDIILLYTKSENYYWGNYRIPVSEKYLDSHYRQKDEKGKRCRIRKDAGKVRVYYPDEGMICNDWWDIPYVNSQAKERTGYPTQKPLELLYRIIEASSRKNGVVFDPFCGCATACVAAQQLGRKWISIDIEAKAKQLVMERLEDDAGLFTNFVHTDITPVRTDIKTVQLDKNSTKQKMYDEQEGKCNGCLVDFPLRNLTIDHKLPRSKGGQDNIENLQLLCGSCNSIKGNRNEDYLRAKLAAWEQASQYANSPVRSNVMKDNGKDMPTPCQRV